MGALDTEPRVSVIIPAFNASATLEDCLKALASQAEPHPPFEVIVVNDGSTDSTGEIAERARARLFRMPHSGAAAARNHGVAHSRGEILLFTDADCEPASDWVQRMSLPFADPTIAGARGVYRSRQTGLVARFVQCEYEDKYCGLKNGQAIDFVDTYSAAYRKSVFQAMGGFDERMIYTEDQEFSFRVAERGGRLVFAPDAIVFHRHADTLSAYAAKKFRIGFWKVAVLLRHPSKLARDSHTPLSQRIQHLLFCLSLPCLAAAPFWRIPRVLLLALLGVFLLMTIPFTLRAWQKDRPVGIIAPILLAIRTISLGLGWLAGIVHFLRL